MAKMKKILIVFLSLLISNTLFASNEAQLTFNIQDPVKTNQYFLCLYGLGCFSLHATNHHIVFPISPIDTHNIKKIVLTDMSNRRLYVQANDPSCQTALQTNQRITISGQLDVSQSAPLIQHLHCSIATNHPVV